MIFSNADRLTKTTLNGIVQTGITVDASNNVSGVRTLSSNVATGTAPFTVASTTKVTNLNADLLDDQTGSYYTDYINFTSPKDENLHSYYSFDEGAKIGRAHV